MNLPPQLKAISHYLKISGEHEGRDPVVSYWALYHSIQVALNLDKSSPACKQYIISLLDHLEAKKKHLGSNEAITNDTVAQAHIENYAIKLFKHADDADRRGEFGKNVVKAFFTASLLIDVLGCFGPVGEEFEKMKKYGKWKAAYIHGCLKKGEMPLPGPVDFDEEAGEDSQSWKNLASGSNTLHNENGSGGGGTDATNTGSNAGPSSFNVNPGSCQDWPPTNDPNPPLNQAEPIPSNANVNTTNATTTLSTDCIQLAQKYTRFATNSLNFDDVQNAVLNLRKALHLLEFGKELE